MKHMYILACILAAQMAHAQKSIDQAMEACRKKLSVPGLAIGVVHKGEVVYVMGYGSRNIAKDLPMTPHTVCPIGSPTKSFTSYLIGQMVDEGRLHWDDRVIDHLPQFQLANPHVTATLTIRDLLQHTTDIPKHDATWYRANIDRKELFDRLPHLPLTKSLERKFIYQNINYLIAGLLVEEIMGLSWEELICQRLLYPLGMRETYCTLLEFGTAHECAQGYRRKHNRITPCPYLDGYLIAPACAINSSVSDLSLWIKHLLGNHEPLLNHTTWKEMIGTGVPSNFFKGLSLGSLTPSWEKYGLGWMLIPYREQQLVAHVGRMDGFTTLVTLIPEEDLGIVVLSNKENSFCPIFATAILVDKFLGLDPIDFSSVISRASIIDGNYAVPLPPRKKHNTHPSHSLSDYCGEYENLGYGKIAITEDEQGLCWHFRSGQTHIEHWHYDVFLLNSGELHPQLQNATFEFDSDIEGDIASVAIAFEAGTEKIRFIKSPEPPVVEAFAKFSGNYQIFGYPIRVFEDMGHLIADIAGIANVELTKEDRNTFSVKNYGGYLIEFIEEENTEITGFQVYKSKEVIGVGFKN